MIHGFDDSRLMSSFLHDLTDSIAQAVPRYSYAHHSQPVIINITSSLFGGTSDTEAWRRVGERVFEDRVRLIFEILLNMAPHMTTHILDIIGEVGIDITMPKASIMRIVQYIPLHIGLHKRRFEIFVHL
jgi:hypothetical protein